jgi:hypothetical protein
MVGWNPQGYTSRIQVFFLKKNGKIQLEKQKKGRERKRLNKMITMLPMVSAGTYAQG